MGKKGQSNLTIGKAITICAVTLLEHIVKIMYNP